MTWELVHTSAPRGVLVSHGGFVTVLATAGMPRPLVEVLEALSAFDPRDGHDAPLGRGGARDVAREPGAPRANSGEESGEPPRETPREAPCEARRERDSLHAHRIVSVAGRRFSVLSRIVRSGVDHTGRPNRLAHHVVIEPRERPAAGPAAALRDFRGFLDRWSGPPTERPFGPIVDAAPRSPAPCASWQRHFGDAGWAGDVLRKILEPPAEPLCVVLPEAIDIRPLVDEMLALLPERDRWAITFASRAVTHRPDVEASLRFVAADDRHLDVVRRRPGARLIEPAGEAPSSRWSEAARRGVALPDSAELGESGEERSVPGALLAERSTTRSILVPGRSAVVEGVAPAVDATDVSGELTGGAVPGRAGDLPHGAVSARLQVIALIVLLLVIIASLWALWNVWTAPPRTALPHPGTGSAFS